MIKIYFDNGESIMIEENFEKFMKQLEKFKFGNCQKFMPVIITDLKGKTMINIAKINYIVESDEDER